MFYPLQSVHHMTMYFKEIWYFLNCIDQYQDIQVINYLTKPAITFKIFPHNFIVLTQTSY